MKWIEIKVVFNPEPDVLIEEMICDIFEVSKTGGVAIERPDFEPVEGWEPGGPVYRATEYCVKGYIPAGEDSEQRCKTIEKGISGLKEQGIFCEITYSTVNDEDWAEKWKEFFRPERISEKIVVSPSWREYASGEGDIVIKIDPGMAFGTGTHATTGMCVSLLEKYLKAGDTFLDIGTGSGILMIAAGLLGAGEMAGTDIDETAVETALKNLKMNNISNENSRLIHGNLSENISEKFDVVGANILAEIIIELIPDLEKVVRRGGLFICSGILDEKAKVVSEKLTEFGFSVEETLFRDSWAAISARFE